MDARRAPATALPRPERVGGALGEGSARRRRERADPNHDRSSGVDLRHFVHKTIADAARILDAIGWDVYGDTALLYDHHKDHRPREGALMAGAKLSEYVPHAERFGTEDVFETAVADLDVMDLGRLALRLRNLNAKWKAPDAGAFALRLLEAGASDKDACHMAGISRTTLWRLRNGQDTPKSPPEPAFQSGGSVSNRDPAGNGSQAAVATADGPYRKAA